jgi:catechol 2,3-dioxygenase-like lactoylglutathione lyase family enzyme
MIACLSHAAFRVIDLDASVDHAIRVLGLRELDRAGDAVFLTHGPPQASLELRAGLVTALDHFALQARSDVALSQLSERLDTVGTAWAEGPRDPGVERTIRFQIPTGHTVDVVLHASDSRVPYGVQGQPGYVPSGVRPRRVGHINLSAADVAGAAEFFTAVLGFRTSDLIFGEEDRLEAAFLRCSSLHHTVAISAGQDGCFHYAYEVDTTQDLVRLGDLLDVVGYRFLWGPGRHGAGDNVAAYHPDPSGLLVETYAEMQMIDDDRWHPRRWSMSDPRVGNIWGAAADPAPVFGASIPLASDPATVG